MSVLGPRRPVAAETGDAFEHSIHYRVICLLMLIWWITYLIPLVAIDNIMPNLIHASEATLQGSAYNQALVVALAALGLIHLPRALRVLASPQAKSLAIVLSLYFMWSISTLVWSVDRSLSIRRLAAFFLILLGCFGLGAGFYSRTRNSIETLARHVIYAAGFAVGLLVFIVLKRGILLDFLNPLWNLKYNTQIECYAYPLGYAILAAVFLLRRSPGRRLALAGSFFLVMVLLKGRTFLIDVPAAAGVIYANIGRSRLVRGIGVSLSIGLGAFLLDLTTGGEYLIRFMLNASDSLAEWMPYLSIGEGIRNITTLSGRLPLWHYLLGWTAERPWQGYGFGAFWAPGRFAEVFAAIKWYAVVAHNGFLDEVLATGLVGLLLLMVFWAYSMYLSFRLGGGGYLTMAWLLLFLFFNTSASIIQSYFAYPTFVSLVALGAVMSEFQVYRCENCGEKLIEQSSSEGPVLCHP
jgi:hypothetical protein